MHFIQEGLKFLEAEGEQQLWLSCRNKMHSDMTKASRECKSGCLNEEIFTNILAFMITNISPKMTFLKDDNNNCQVFTRPRTADELRFIDESRLPVRGENENQNVESVRKRKLSTVAMSPTRKNNNHIDTPDTVQSPNIGSMIRPYRGWNPTTPIINMKTVLSRF